MNESDFSFLVAVTGDSRVGKSQLLQHELGNFLAFSGNESAKNLVWTEEKLYTLTDYTTLVQFIDIPGADRFIKLLHRYAAGACVSVYVFDLVNLSSFERLEDRFTQMELSENPRILSVVIGNKADLIAERQVKYEQAFEWAKEHGMHYFETSSVTGEGVSAVFSFIVTSVLNLLEQLQYEPSCLLEKRIKINRKTLEYADTIYL